MARVGQDIMRQVENEMGNLRQMNEQYKITETRLTRHLKRLSEKMKTTEKQTDEYYFQIVELREQLTQIEGENRQLQRIMSQTNEQLKKITEENKQLQEAYIKTNEQLKEIIEENKQLQEANIKTNEQLKKITEENQLLQEANINYRKDVEEKEKKLQELAELHNEDIEKFSAANHIAESERLDVERAVKQMERETQQLREHVKSLQSQLGFEQTERKECLKIIECLEQDKRDFISRLRKLASVGRAPLSTTVQSDNSDEDRPTKLSEEFEDFYTNEWLNAFHLLAFGDEQEKIQFLLGILKRVYQLCSDVFRRNVISVRHSLSTLTVRVGNDDGPNGLAANQIKYFS